MTYDEIFEYEQEKLKTLCDVDSVPAKYMNLDGDAKRAKIRAIDKGAVEERKTLYLSVAFGWYEDLGFGSNKELFNSDLITSKCAAECYKQVNRAKVELIVHNGNFEEVGKMPSSHLDAFLRISSDSGTDEEFRVRVKAVYDDLYIKKVEGDDLTAKRILGYIREKYEGNSPKEARKKRTIESSASTASRDEDFGAFNFDDDEDDASTGPNSNDKAERKPSISHQQLPSSDTLVKFPSKSSDDLTEEEMDLYLSSLAEWLNDKGKISLTKNLIAEILGGKKRSLWSLLRIYKSDVGVREYKKTLKKALSSRPWGRSKSVS